MDAVTLAAANAAAKKQFADSRLAGPYTAKAAAALQPFRAALAGRLSAPCNIAVLGDSTDEGTGAGSTSAARNLSWPDRLAQLLRYRYPTTGEKQGAVAPNYVPVGTDSTIPTGWTVGGGWVKHYQFGPSALEYSSTTAGNTLTYTIPVGVTSLDLVYVKGTSITGFTYSVDGAAASAAVGPVGTGGTVDGGTTRITGWDPATTHTLVITSVGTNSYFDGVLLYSGNETAGIRVFNCGHHGSRTTEYLNGAVNGFQNWIGSTPTALGGVQSMTALNPDLVVVSWGYNDINNAIPSATFQASIATIVATVRAQLPSKIIPVIYLDKWTPGPTWINGNVEPWANYAQAMGNLATADPYGVRVSLGQTMPQPGSTLATSAALYIDSGVHGAAKGYSMAADQLASLIGA